MKCQAIYKLAVIDVFKAHSGRMSFDKRNTVFVLHILFRDPWGVYSKRKEVVFYEMEEAEVVKNKSQIVKLTTEYYLSSVY